MWDILSFLSRNGCIYIVQVLDVNIFYCQINDINLQNNYLVCLVLFCLYITFWSFRIYILHSGISKYTSDFEFHVITNQTLSLSLYNTLLFFLTGKVRLRPWLIALKKCVMNLWITWRSLARLATGIILSNRLECSVTQDWMVWF